MPAQARFVVQLCCPRCRASTFVPQNQVPLSKNPVRCKQCTFAFEIDLTHETHCRVGMVEGRIAPVGADGLCLPDYGPYRIQKPCCKGFAYKHKALAALIKSGLVDYTTPICPPQSDHFLPAGELLELRQFFCG